MHLMTFCAGLLIGSFGPPLMARLMSLGEKTHRMGVDEILAAIPRQRERNETRKS